MSRADPHRHPSSSELADYFGHRLPEFMEARIERHLADCTDCVRRARRVRAFKKVWDCWDARTHAGALKQQAFADGLAKLAKLAKGADAPELTPDPELARFGDRLLDWSKRLAALRDDVGEALSGAGMTLARGVGEELVLLRQWGSICSLRLAAAGTKSSPAGRRPLETRGTVGTRGAEPPSEPVVLARRELAPEVFLEVRCPAAPGEKIEIALSGLYPENDPPLVTVMPLSAAEPARGTQVRRPEQPSEARGPAAPQPILVHLNEVREITETGKAEFVGRVTELPEGELFFALEPLNHSPS